ncbi:MULTISPECIES: hypothetical protein [unclassified Achromobacter]|uniref:hypothetical protein n=1 Tax=unclassified Achromobacter TaxID=2626865 RepID=UPI000B516CCB|nr:MULTISPECIES: hypothetical protein [unclassified Achromobacter]OWT75703.1 hypothetical protein CEY04_19340 [Achromobacter sp. HZ28]OWT76364.1 hypothetical protein CEY05_14790 [Achromobacter sp. HZ34]
MPMMRFHSPIFCALPPDASAKPAPRDAALTAPMMDATYRMLATLDEMSKASRMADMRELMLDNSDENPDETADKSARSKQRRRRSTDPEPSREAAETARLRAEFNAELAQRKTEDLERIELTGYSKDDTDRVLSLVEQLKRHMVDHGLNPRLFEIKIKRIAFWDDQSKHGSVDIHYVAATSKKTRREAAAPAPEPAAAPTPPVVRDGNRRRQSYAILEEVTPWATTPASFVRHASMRHASMLPVGLSTVERRSLDIIAFDVKKSFGRDASEITLTGYTRANAQSVMPKLEKMADYLAHTKGLRRDSIRLDPRRLDPVHDQAGVWDQRVEIDVRDPARDGARPPRQRRCLP